MRSDARDHDLLFLLGLTMLGCPAEEDPADDDGAGTSNATSGMTDPGSMSGAMSTSTQGMTSMEATTAEETSADGSGTTGEVDCADVELPQTGPVSQLCLDQVAHAEECYGALPEGCAEVYAAYCQYSLEYFEQTYGPGCAAAYEALVACLNAVDCGEIDDETVCMAETFAAEKQCA